MDAAPQESCGADFYGEEGKKGMKEGWKERLKGEEFKRKKGDLSLRLLRLYSTGCRTSGSGWLYTLY